ncbi:ArsC family reductase [Thauera chlorobenzoica]|uniref:Glutathione-dependent thiol reductase n=1 Tax=Thauera chlorobenzoica TaxID=96773 RepID=A0A1H5V3K2_9RHOO|nr:ArsC family reductase [Thauera chlorobenzoica]APR05463.1 glutathione-dependent thiol reductase [Thauera chlorobenzoica]SEF81311.1 transcriptional regulator, Spx/MgsR family [Thauera chlorobenzoica]
MQAVIHGIKNCDTMKKTFAWFEGAGVAYRFHDYKKSAIDTATLQRWCERLGWEALVNKRGTTWRRLSPEQQTISSEAAAIALMQAHPSLIRRPLIEAATGELVVGLDPERFAAVFAGNKP